MAFYYPEGYFGPICDAGIDDFTLANLQRAAQVDDDDFVVVFDSGLGDDVITLQGEPVLTLQRCKQRPDGTFYDCVYEWINYQDAWDDFDRCLDPYGVCYPWKDVSTKGLRLEEDFFVPELDSETCSPFDSDINIREQSYFTSTGSLIRFGKIERSSPVTFPVTSKVESVVAESTIDAYFNGAGDLVVTGSGSGLVRLDFEYDDNPNTAGQALGTYTVAGRTFVQEVDDEEGSDSDYVEVSVGTYPATISGGSGYGGFTRKDNNKQLCFFDDDGDDCNATVTIRDIIALSTTSYSGYWSETGNKYAVWVNPEVCTLPQEEQEVTYIVPIPATDTYTFEFGADDNAQMFLNGEQTPAINAVGGIFAAGAYSTPYTHSRQLTGGTNLEIVVRCTNSDAGFVDGQGRPTGLAYSWERNPGGWFIKICRGGGCVRASNINWVPTGPAGWGDFMDQYAVYPSNYDTLLYTVYSGTYFINVPYEADYVLEYGVDDDGTWTLDGTLIITSGYQPNSSTYTISNLTSGTHELVVTVENNGPGSTDWDSNPGGIAWTLKPLTGAQAGEVIASSLDLTTQADGNLIWHTRLATGYEYYEVTEN